MREGGDDDDDKGMVSVIEGVWSLGGRDVESHEEWDCFKIQEINRLKRNDSFFFKKKDYLNRSVKVLKY